MALRAIKRAKEAGQKRELVPGSRHKVIVTHINGPKSFYVRCLSFNTYPDLEIPRRLITDVEMDKLVVYKSETLKKTVRGQIKYIKRIESEIICHIYAIDYGCYDQSVSIKDIFELFPLAEFCPPLAVPCELSLCEPRTSDGFDEEVIDTMKYYIGTEPAQILVRSKNRDHYVVDLMTLECPDDVSTMLALLNLTQMTSTTMSVSRFRTSIPSIPVIRYTFKEVKVGEKINVRYLTGNSVENFHVAQIGEYKKYMQTQSEFNDYCKKQGLQDVNAAVGDGRSCAVKLDMPSEYGRAIVKKVIEPDQTALVKFIDLGKAQEVPFGDIKKMPSEYFTVNPALAIYCTAAEDQKFPKFHRAGFQFAIEIIEVGDGIHVPHKVKICSMHTNTTVESSH